MFQHIITLFAFIFAIALTHVFASATDLIRERDRLRFSWLLALWMVNATASLLVNWLWLFELNKIKAWSIDEVLNQLIWVIPQYFVCSLIAMRVPNAGTIDMPAFYAKQRPILFSAYVALFVASIITNYVDRNNLSSWKPGEWISADVLVLPMLAAAIVAGWARPMWLQWTAAVATFGLSCWFLVSYT